MDIRSRLDTYRFKMPSCMQVRIYIGARLAR